MDAFVRDVRDRQLYGKPVLSIEDLGRIRQFRHAPLVHPRRRATCFPQVARGELRPDPDRGADDVRMPDLGLPSPAAQRGPAAGPDRRRHDALPALEVGLQGLVSQRAVLHVGARVASAGGHDAAAMARLDAGQGGVDEAVRRRTRLLPGAQAVHVAALKMIDYRQTVYAKRVRENPRSPLHVMSPKTQGPSHGSLSLPDSCQTFGATMLENLIL